VFAPHVAHALLRAVSTLVSRPACIVTPGSRLANCSELRPFSGKFSLELGQLQIFAFLAAKHASGIEPATFVLVPGLLH
jgi:hypothetical protein